MGLRCPVDAPEAAALKGDIVGHNARRRIAPRPKVYEGKSGLALPAYRNTAKFFKRLVAVGIEAVPAFPLAGRQ